MTNEIDHPPHYGGPDDPYEAIKVIEAWQLGFNLGNLLKYVRRADVKGDPIENLKKAAFYLNREIETRTREEAAFQGRIAAAQAEIAQRQEAEAAEKRAMGVRQERELSSMGDAYKALREQAQNEAFRPQAPPLPPLRGNASGAPARPHYLAEVEGDDDDGAAAMAQRFKPKP